MATAVKNEFQQFPASIAMRKNIAIFGLIVIVGMCIFPPWNVYHQNSFSRALHNSIEIVGVAPSRYEGNYETQYRLLFAPPEWEDGSDEYVGEIDTGRLLTQILIAAGVFGIFALLTGSKA